MGNISNLKIKGSTHEWNIKKLKLKENKIVEQKKQSNLRPAILPVTI